MASPQSFSQSLQVLSFDEVCSKLKAQSHPSRQTYAAMYSSWYGGIIKDPQLMMIPIDDHGFHRGDAVFEAIKCLRGNIYGLTRHLERMQVSANLIELKMPKATEELFEIAVETVKIAGLKDCLLRFYVSRGPGGFTANPYESIQAQIYLVITPFVAFSQDKYESGVSVKISSIRVKESFFATVKSCNYLPNVLMKKEAVDAGVDFTISKDEDDHLAEGSTENFAIISKQNELVVPGFQRTLKGVTASRAMELASELVRTGVLSSVRNGPILPEDVLSAKEAMMLGTTLDCLPVTRFENQLIGDGKPGAVVREISRLIKADMQDGPLVTPISPL